MIFCAFLDPESVAAIEDGGGVGDDHLLGVMRSLLESCFLAETYTYDVGPELIRKIAGLKDYDTRLRAGILLETFKKRDRFVPVLVDEGLPAGFKMTALAQAQSENPYLDIVITEETPGGRLLPEFTHISRFNRSSFEEKRQRFVAEGMTLKPDQISAAELFEKCFGRMLLGCDSFVIEDYMIGKDFGANYFENLPHWCSYFSSCGRPVVVTIETQSTSLGIIRSLETRLKEISDGTSVQFKVRTIANPRHERFFHSLAFSVQIGRGIDLCDSFGRNRDIKVNFGK